MYVAFRFGSRLTILGATNGVARIKKNRDWRFLFSNYDEIFGNISLKLCFLLGHAFGYTPCRNLLPPQNKILLLSLFFKTELFIICFFVEENAAKRFWSLDTFVIVHAGSYSRIRGKNLLTFQSFSLHFLPRPPQNEIRLLSRFFCYSRSATKVKVEHAGFYIKVQKKFLTSLNFLVANGKRKILENTQL